MKFEEILSMKDGPERTAALAHWVQHLYPQGISPPVLVGGAAVELYTGGAYVTGDLDFVGSVPATVRRSLKDSGFNKEGRHWIHEAGEIFLEFPSAVISEGDEKAILRRGGIEVITICPESLIIDRLRSLIFWNYREDGLNAFLLVRAQKESISPAKVSTLAKDADVKGAFESLWQLAGKNVKRKPSQRAVDDWLERYL